MNYLTGVWVKFVYAGSGFSAGDSAMYIVVCIRRCEAHAGEKVERSNGYLIMDVR